MSNFRIRILAVISSLIFIQSSSALNPAEQTPKNGDWAAAATPASPSSPHKTPLPGVLGDIGSVISENQDDLQARLKRLEEHFPEKFKEVQEKSKDAEKAQKENNPRLFNKYIGGVENPLDVIEEHAKDFNEAVLPELSKMFNPLGGAEGCPSYTIHPMRACYRCVKHLPFGGPCITWEIVPAVSYRYSVDKIENTFQAFTSRYVPKLVFDFSKTLMFGPGIPVSDLMRATSIKKLSDLTTLLTNKLRVTIQMKQDVAQFWTLLAANGMITPGKDEDLTKLKDRLVDQLSKVQASDKAFSTLDEFNLSQRGFNADISQGAYIHSEFRVVPEILSRWFQEEIMPKIPPFPYLAIRISIHHPHFSLKLLRLRLTCHDNLPPLSPDGSGGKKAKLNILDFFQHTWASDLPSFNFKLGKNGSNFPSGGYTVTRFPFFILLDARYKMYKDALLQFYKNPFQCSNIALLRQFYPVKQPNLLNLQEVAGRLNDISGLIGKDLNKPIANVPDQYQACMKFGLGSYLPMTNQSPTRDKIVAAASGVLKSGIAYVDKAENFYQEYYNRAKGARDGVNHDIESAIDAEFDKVQWIFSDLKKNVPHGCFDPEMAKEKFKDATEDDPADPGTTAIHWRQLSCCPYNSKGNHYKQLSLEGAIGDFIRTFIPLEKWKKVTR